MGLCTAYAATASTGVVGELPVLYTPRSNFPKEHVVNINHYHCAGGHSNEVLLLKTAEYRVLALEGNLLE